MIADNILSKVSLETKKRLLWRHLILKKHSLDTLHCQTLFHSKILYQKHIHFVPFVRFRANCSTLLWNVLSILRKNELRDVERKYHLGKIQKRKLFISRYIAMYKVFKTYSPKLLTLNNTF